MLLFNRIRKANSEVVMPLRGDTFAAYARIDKVCLKPHPVL